MIVTSPFSLSLVAITALAFLGLPIGHAMIAGSILYLWLAGLDMGTAAEQLLNGTYSSFLLLAIPLFVLAATLMSTGPVLDRLLNFCNALVGRFRGGLAGSEWILLELHGELAHGGFGHGSLRAWTADGDLVATGSQSASMRFLFDEGELPAPAPEPRAE